MTTQALEKLTPQSPAVPADVSALALQSALAGDLSRLTAEDRLKYYGKLCEITGLNPLSKPFDWIQFQGKLVLYANKGCAEQLRKIHGVKIPKDKITQRFEHGLYIVEVEATDANGRQDFSTGAVPFDDKMPAADKANAIMKAETKAKRRVTLSICGLGMLDESELDTMREARRAEPMIAQVAPAISDSAALDELNSLSKPPIDAEIISSTAAEPVSQTRQQEPTTAQPAAASDLATPPTDLAAEPVQSTAPPASVQPVAGETVAAVWLTDETTANLHTVITEERPSDALAYMAARGWMKKGANLNTVPLTTAQMIIKKAQVFHRQVAEWVANGRKPFTKETDIIPR